MVAYRASIWLVRGWRSGWTMSLHFPLRTASRLTALWAKITTTTDPNGRKTGVVSEISGADRRRSDPPISGTTLERCRSGSVPAVTGSPRHPGRPVSEITDPPRRRSDALISETGLERRRSMVVSAVNGTDRCPDGVVSAVNDTPVDPIILKVNDLERLLWRAVCDRPLPRRSCMFKFRHRCPPRCGWAESHGGPSPLYARRDPTRITFQLACLRP
jgi:hypothetical protein